MFRNLLKPRRFPLRRCYSSCPPTPSSEFPTVQAVLNNEIRVVTEQTSSPIACVSLFINTGSRYETPECNGINNFIEHMAFKGTTKMPKHVLEAFAMETGARFDALTSQEFQRFSVTCTPEFIQIATDVLCGIVSQLSMDDQEIEHARESICREMIEADTNYKKLVFENLIASAFHGTSLGQKVVGSNKNMASFDGCCALEYMAEQYQPWRLVFSTSGPVTNDCMVDYVRTCLDGMEATRQESDRGGSRFTSSSVIYRDDSRDCGYAAVAFEAPGFLSKDYLAMLVIKNMLGSWSPSLSGFGAWPELAMRCADTQLCMSYKNFYITFGDVGLCGVYFVSGRMDCEDFLENYQDVIKNVCCVLRQSDVDRAKRATLLELCRMRTGAFNSSVSMGKEVLYKNKRPTLANYMKDLYALGVPELTELAYKVFYNAHPVVSAAGATESLPDYTRTAAGQYWIRW